MTGAEARGESLENRVLRARARGEVSADAAFEELYREYARTVSAWLALRSSAAAVDDLAQDVWLIFYSRFKRWEFGTEMESPEARPVLSFLFRTCQYVARGHRRFLASRSTEKLETPEMGPVVNGRQALVRQLEASRALEVASRVCSDEEIEVLLAKLGGMTGKEIAKALSVTEAVVDHRYRNALTRLKKELNIGKETSHG